MEKRLEAAMRKAVELGIFPPTVPPEAYEDNWKRLASVLEAADAATDLFSADADGLRDRFTVALSPDELEFVTKVAARRLRKLDTTTNMIRVAAGLGPVARGASGARNGRSSARRKA